MFNKTSSDVLVVGAGPVGLFAALACAKKGLNVRIIDREWRTGTHSYALALHPRSIELLEEAGAREAVLDQARRIRRIALADGDGVRTTIPLASLGDDFAFISVVRQDDLERVLEDELRGSGVRVMWQHEASLVRETSKGVDVRVDRLEVESRGYGIEHAEKVVTRTQTMESGFVIGADGYNSDVRQSLGIAYDDLGEARQFVVFEVKTDADLDDTMTVVLHDGLTSVLWPMLDGFCRWSFEIDDEDIHAQRRQKDRYVTEDPDPASAAFGADELARLISERAPWFTGDIESIAWRKVVRFDRRLAASFGAGRVWLAGDAAHMTGPGGVQSMNVGLQEGARLAELIDGVQRDQADPSTVGVYDEERRTEWRRLLGVDPLVASPGADPWLAANIQALLPSLPLSGRSLKAALSHLGFRVDREPANV